MNATVPARQILLSNIEVDRSIPKNINFETLVALISRAQKMRGGPRIVRCATKGVVRTYRMKGSKGTWEITIKTRDIVYDARKSDGCFWTKARDLLGKTKGGLLIDLILFSVSLLEKLRALGI